MCLGVLIDRLISIIDEDRSCLIQMRYIVHTTRNDDENCASECTNHSLFVRVRPKEREKEKGCVRSTSFVSVREDSCIQKQGNKASISDEAIKLQSLTKTDMRTSKPGERVKARFW